MNSKEKKGHILRMLVSSLHRFWQVWKFPRIQAMWKKYITTICDSGVPSASAPTFAIHETRPMLDGESSKAIQNQPTNPELESSMTIRSGSLLSCYHPMAQHGTDRALSDQQLMLKSSISINLESLFVSKGVVRSIDLGWGEF